MEDLALQNQNDQRALYDEMNERLLEQKAELEANMRENETRARLEMEGIENVNRTLQKHEQELINAMEERERIILELKRQT
jgi:microsomal dipeptidase-like Zn-dependent dipeptidase